MSKKDNHSESETKLAPPPVPASELAFSPEAQRERWLKYGVNVLMTSVIVIVLAVVVIWATTKGSVPLGSTTLTTSARKDFTSGASHQLKPQTLAVIRDLPADKEVTLVSLYPKLKKEEATAKGADTYQSVQDILDEYRRNSKNIKVENIDPINEPAKLDGWIGEVKRKYGKNIENYEKFIKEFPKSLEEIKKLATAEAGQLEKVFAELEPQVEKLTDEQLAVIRGTLVPARNTVLLFPQVLEGVNESAKTELEQKIPDYGAAVASVKGGLNGLSRQCDALGKAFAKLKDSPNAVPLIKQYAVDAIPRFNAIKAKADESVKKTESLGELKLDDVRKKLMPSSDGEVPPPAIAVMGESDIKVIDDFSLWKGGEGTGLTGRAAEKPRLRFAGEQQLTSAILTLSQAKKQRVAFIRSGGEPRVGGSRRGPAMFSELADRLRSYNFDVVEKDFAPPSPQQQRMPTPNEPTDEELKDAIWVVCSSEPDQQSQMMGLPVGMLGERLKAHLDGGGSALCLIDVQGEDLGAALRDWGIEVKSNVVLVHEKIEGGETDPDDFIEQARRQPFIFILNEFGEHPITTPLRSLDAVMVPMIQIKKTEKSPADVKITQIIPIPNNPPAWGETDLTSIRGQQRASELTNDKAVDAQQPLFAGAVAEKTGKGRLVVLGSQITFNSSYVNFPDPKLAKAKPPTIVSRFPATGELFTNSIFWLANNEKMIALSPSALDTARISPVSNGMLHFLRTGVVLILLPLLSVAAGLGIWMTRRG